MSDAQRRAQAMRIVAGMRAKGWRNATGPREAEEADIPDRSAPRLGSTTVSPLVREGRIDPIDGELLPPELDFLAGEAS